MNNNQNHIAPSQKPSSAQLGRFASEKDRQTGSINLWDQKQPTTRQEDAKEAIQMFEQAWDVVRGAGAVGVGSNGVQD
ncbi:hypothetical protein MKZ38_009188 [Zalerion maritima]|uniref:Uncharacterized protein n=1 Tax=Zalerion maritima TaxID=339359 RepID=A0AAD5RTQ3_9PEZI|nr:hypothetical protein MKZ38_009188 [Zalerion maritima]